ncbi:hypothetical protein CLIM01_12629 [Colletotrichum limetticola]|uniref:Uncharacterized protein n=1 Tax=Colletotrichum limetticola TaxID=1209924 RepID=A0ABQ9PDT5_9PEZI|nr:hypothetical protein CLIM01_12629 [Colletotrichum limetticola]
MAMAISQKPPSHASRSPVIYLHHPGPAPGNPRCERQRNVEEFRRPQFFISVLVRRTS